MKKRVHFLYTIILLLLLNMPANIFAQCFTASNGQYPSGIQTISACNGSFTTFATDCYNGEYTKMNVTSGNAYTFKSSVAADLITISNSGGTVSYATGTGIATWTATFTGTVRFYTHANSSCGDDQVNKSRMAACSGNTVAQCLTAIYGQWPTATQSIATCNGSFTTFATDCYNGEYTMINVTSGNAYTFKSSVATDLITISNSGGTTSYATGTGIATWTATFTGTVRFYTHANSSCGEDQVNKSRMAACGTTSTCASPSSITASAVTNTTATISWSAASPAPSSGYQYEIRTSGTGGSGAAGLAKSGSTAAGVTTANITGLTLGTLYHTYVRSNCGTSQSGYATGSDFTTTGSVASLVPAFDHIVVVIGENTNQSSVFGSSSAPYINALAAAGAKFTNSFGLSHPSQPNYLQLYSGSNQGITNDNNITTKFVTANLGRELIDAGKTYITYSEGLPSVGYNGSSNGAYVRKHNPAANWMGTSTNQIATTTNQPFTSFPSSFSSLPSVSFVVPDLCNDGHDVCSPINNSVLQYDTWIKNNLDAYKQWCVNNNSLLIVTYDEDNFTTVNKIATVFYGAHVANGVYSQTINHYGVLRMIEEANRLTTHAGSAASATVIDYCWTSALAFAQSANGTIGLKVDKNISVLPNPFSNTLNITYQLEKDSKVQIEIYDMVGQRVYSSNNKLTGMQQSGKHTFQINASEINSKQNTLFLKLSINGVVTQRLLNKTN